MTITNPLRVPPAQTSAAIRGRVTEPGIYIDPDTGGAVVSRSVNIAFYVLDVSAIIDAAVLSDEVFKGWIVSLVTPNGETFIGTIREPLYNRTFGYVHTVLRRKS